MRRNRGQGGADKVRVPSVRVAHRGALLRVVLVQRVHLAHLLVARVPELHARLPRLHNVVHDVQLQVVDAATHVRRRRASQTLPATATVGHGWSATAKGRGGEEKGREKGLRVKLS